MKVKLLVLLGVMFLFQFSSVGQEYEDGVSLKYRMSLIPLELSAEWMTADRNWSTKLSTGISANYFHINYFDENVKDTRMWSINPKVGLDFRKYFGNVNYDKFFGYYMEVSTRYFFAWTDYDSFLWVAYHVGGTLPVGENAYINGAVGAGLYNNNNWGFGPTGTFGIGIDLN